MSDASQGSDEDLVRRVRAGDEAAARLLFDRHLPALRAKARARLPAALRGKVAESDVVQEAWLAAFLSIGRFEDRGEGSFAAWLRTILEHKIGHEIERNLAAGKRDVRREQRALTGSDGGFGATPDQPSPSEVAIAAEEHETLRAAVAELPDDYATVLRLVHIEGLKLADAGARMGRSADAARKLYSRAMTELAARLDPADESGT